MGAIAAGGGCVARAPDGKVVFVRHSLPGERVRAQVTSSTSSYLRADAVEILRPSPDRVEPPCPHAGPGRCGGCDFQHVELGAQRRLEGLPHRRAAGAAGRASSAAVEVEPVPGDADGPGLAQPGAGRGGRPRARWGSGATAPTGSSTSTSAPSPARRSPRPAPSPSCGPAPPSSRSRPGRTRRGGGLGHAAGPVRAPPARPRHRRRGRREGPPPARRRACRRARAHLPDFARGLLAGPHRRRGGAARRGARASSATCAGASVVDLYAGAGLFSVPLADAVGPTGSVLAVERDRRACADARHNGATFPNLRVLEGEVTPALVESAPGPARHRRAGSRPRGCRDRRHAGPGRAHARPCAR